MDTKFDRALKWVGVILLGIFAAIIVGLILYWIYGELNDKARHVMLVLVTLMLAVMYELGEARGGAYRKGFEDAHAHNTTHTVNAPPASVYTPPQTIIEQVDRLPTSYAAVSPDLNDRIMQAVKGSEL